MSRKRVFEKIAEFPTNPHFRVLNLETPSFGMPAAQPLVLFRVAQEIHHLGHFAFGFFDTGHVAEIDGWPLPDEGIFPAAKVALIHDHADDDNDDQQI